MKQLELPLKLKPIFDYGLFLKPKRGYSKKFSSCGRPIKKYVVGHKDHRGYTRLHERNPYTGFDWLLTEKEIEQFFEPY